MGLIIKNGVQYIGGEAGLAENIQYDSAESGLNATNVQDAIDEIIANGGTGGGGGNASERVLTQEEYDALGDEKYTDNITYYITDSEELSAHNIEFDGSKINMKVASVQEAIEQIYNLNADIVITLDKDSWVYDTETGLYKQDIEMDGLTGKEVPIMILTSNSDEAKAAWAKVNNPEIKEGLISFNADENIDVELTVVAKGMVTKPTNIVADVTDIRNDIEAMEDRVGSVETLAAAAESKANENANAISALDDRYYTETEIDGKVNIINQAVNANIEAINKTNNDLTTTKNTLTMMPYIKRKQVNNSFSFTILNASGKRFMIFGRAYNNDYTVFAIINTFVTSEGVRTANVLSLGTCKVESETTTLDANNTLTITFDRRYAVIDVLCDEEFEFG